MPPGTPGYQKASYKTTGGNKQRLNQVKDLSDPNSLVTKQAKYITIYSKLWILYFEDFSYGSHILFCIFEVYWTWKP